MMGFLSKQLFTSYLCRVRQRNLIKPFRKRDVKPKSFRKRFALGNASLIIFVRYPANKGFDGQEGEVL